MKAYTVTDQPLSWAKVLTAALLYRQKNYRESKANWGYKRAAGMLHWLCRAPGEQQGVSSSRKKGEGMYSSFH